MSQVGPKKVRIEEAVPAWWISLEDNQIKLHDHSTKVPCAACSDCLYTGKRCPYRVARSWRETVELDTTYMVEGKIQECYWGLHASQQLKNAYFYRPAGWDAYIYRVLLWGEVEDCGDKLVASRRTTIGRIRANEPLLWGSICTDWERLIRDRRVPIEGELMKHAWLRKFKP